MIDAATATAIENVVEDHRKHVATAKRLAQIELSDRKEIVQPQLKRWIDNGRIPVLVSQKYETVFVR